MPVLPVRPAGSCRYDLISLGEVMLRLDPGESRIRTTRQFTVWEGGGEYNVARGLRRCFGLRTAVVTALADNEIGHLIEDLILQGGVDTSLIRWVDYDSVGRAVRNGLNFTERGFGLRGALGVSDRGHTAASQLQPGHVDWERLFGELGARWLHTGGIYAALSDSAAEVLAEALAAARRHGTVISYDLNYRPSLWAAVGGRERAQEVNQRLAPYIDVMIGNEEDFTACLGFQVPGTDGAFSVLDPAVAWADGVFAHATPRPAIEILDRIGGGDSFASGLIYGLLQGDDIQTAVDYGAAHGALAMTTPGDTSMATLAEVRRLMAGSGARVRR